MDPIIANNLQNINRLSKKFRRILPVGMGREDLISVGLTAVWKLDPGISPKLVQRKIHWAMLDAIRSWRPGRQHNPVTTEPLDNSDELVDMNVSTPEDHLIATQGLNRFIPSLNSREMQVLEHMYDGKNLVTIAKELNLTYTRIFQIKTKAFEKFKDAMD